MPDPIEPNTRRNRHIAVLLLLLAAFPMIAAVAILFTVRQNDFWLAAFPGGLSIFLFGWAWRLWRTPPSGARIDFLDTGFRLTFLPHGRAPRKLDIDWSEVREIRYLSGGYSARGLDFLLTHDGALRHGLVRDSTRRDAPDLLVKRKIAVSPHTLELQGKDVVARMTEAARQAGFDIVRTSYRYLFFFSVTKWQVRRSGARRDVDLVAETRTTAPEAS